MIKYTVEVYPSGIKIWYLNDKIHREDGPAFENHDGGKSWYIGGKLHREDGPAIEFAGGRKDWYLHGKKLTEEEHKVAISKPTLFSIYLVEIDGRTFEMKEIIG